MSSFEDQVADLLMGGDRPVTQAMHDWDGVMTPFAIWRVAEQESRDNDPETDRSDGKGRIRPSNLSSPCARLHVFSWLGAPKEWATPRSWTTAPSVTTTGRRSG